MLRICCKNHKYSSKRPLYIALLVIMLASASFAKTPTVGAGWLPFDCGKKLYLDGKTGGHWLNLGPTGIRAYLFKDDVTETGSSFDVQYIFPDSPAAGKIKVGDLILGANGRRFTGFTSQEKGVNRGFPVWWALRAQLGMAIEDSEGDPKLNGQLTFMVNRGGKIMDVVVPLRHLGYFSKSFPFDCKKSEALIKDACEWIITPKWTAAGVLLDPPEKGAGKPGIYARGHWDSQIACILALMAQGETYMPLLKDRMEKRIAKGESPGSGWNWCNALRMIELSEWYLLTKDKRVIPMIKKEEAILCDNQAPNGGFQHGKYKERAYGTMAGPAGLACIGWALMKQGGIPIDEEHYRISRYGLTWSTQKSGEIGYGVGMYSAPNIFPPSGWKPPSSYNPEDGLKAVRGGLGGSTASIMHYLDPMDACSETYYRRGIIHAAAGAPQLFHGHASGCLHGWWSWLACGLGTVVDDMQSYRKMMDYYKAWLNVNRCHDGSFYMEPVGDIQNDPFRDLRFELTGATILFLSVPKHSLAILGRDTLIPGVDKSVLSSSGLALYNTIRNGKGRPSDMMRGLLSLKTNAIGKEKDALNLLIDYVTKPAVGQAERLTALGKSRDFYKLMKELSAADSSYKGIEAYDAKTAPLREALSAAENQKILMAGKAFYTRILPMYESKSGIAGKRGLMLEATKTFVDTPAPEPYAAMARKRAGDLLQDLNEKLRDIVSLREKNDLWGAAMKIAEADKDYASFALYVEKTKLIRQALAAPENKELMQLGSLYYKLIEPGSVRNATAYRKGRLIQILGEFTSRYQNKPPYGDMARNERQRMISEMDQRIKDIAVTHKIGDTYQASLELQDSDKEYSALPEYAEKTLSLRTELRRPQSQAQYRAGADFKALQNFVTQMPGERAQRRIELFVKANSGNLYGEKAKSLLTPTDIAGAPTP